MFIKEKSSLMVEYVLIAVVVLLCGILVFYKKKRDKEFKEVKDKIKSEQKNLSIELSKIVSSMSDSIKESNDSLNYKIVQNNKAISELNKTIDDTKDDLTDKYEMLNDEINTLSNSLESLRKDLYNYTKIDEDAVSLNVSEDEEKENELLLKAIEELEYFEDTEIDRSSEAVNTTEQVLDDEQKNAAEIILHTCQNIFITGKAGTGKSFLLKSFFGANKDKRYIILAPTGIAALNIGGATLHATFGYKNLVDADIDELEKGKLKLNSDKRNVLKNVDAIIIDEISMVRADTLEKIDRILKIVCGNRKLFGGKQMIFFGDIFQLPPIATAQEEMFLAEKFGGKYFFDADVYKNGNFKFVELSVNHRNKDDEPYFNILNGIREGRIGSSLLDTLNMRTKFNKDDLDRTVIRLFPTKASAENINNIELEKINEKEYTYEAKVTFDASKRKGIVREGSFPIVHQLRLKVGAVVMMVANDAEKRWVNGSIGIVSKLGEDYIKVSIADSHNVTHEFEVIPYEFEEKEAIYRNGKIYYDTTYKVKQYPVILAYAITIHKSQGMTYNSIACDLSGCFASGQAYVALSRCRTLSGLYLLNEVTEGNISVDKHVRDFYIEQKEHSK